MKQIILALVLLTIAGIANSQTVKAITQHGETVVLYENGTWKYEKDINTNANTPTVVAPVTRPAVSDNKIDIDASKVASSEKTEIFNAVSKKLSRFFGEEKGRVRCSAVASNNKGDITLNFEFMMPLGDANRYFGYSAQDRSIVFQLADGSTVTSTFTTNTEEKFIEKWNVSYYKAGVVLSHDEVIKLIKNNTLKITVDWKKVEEEYNVDNFEAIKVMLAEVL